MDVTAGNIVHKTIWLLNTRSAMTAVAIDTVKIVAFVEYNLLLVYCACFSVDEKIQVSMVFLIELKRWSWQSRDCKKCPLQ